MLRGDDALALATVTESMRGFVDDDDDSYFAEMLTIVALALEGLERKSECQVVATTLDRLLAQAPPGSLDAWATEQAEAVLKRWPAETGRARSYASIVAMLDGVVASLDAAEGIPA